MERQMVTKKLVKQPDIKYTWIKYRTKHAWGKQDWEYAEIMGGRNTKLFKEELSIFVENIHSKYEWSDKYRGCEVKTIKNPPEKVIMSRINSMKNVIADSKQRMERYRLLLDAK